MIGYKQLVIKQVIFEEFQVEKELIEDSKPNRQGKYPKNIYVSCN